MTYIVIYNKITKKILRVIEQTDKLVSVGYSDNCEEVRLNERPTGDRIDL